jgi:hypothetical protein
MRCGSGHYRFFQHPLAGVASALEVVLVDFASGTSRLSSWLR